MSTPAERPGTVYARRLPILLVHDDVAMQASLEALLATDTLFAAVSTATEGLHRLTTMRPDLVILDPALPDLNGFHFLQALRSHAPTCSVILITSSRAELTRHITVCGIAGCWSRPLHMAPLLAQLCLLPPLVGHPRLMALRGSTHTGRVLDYIRQHYIQPLTVPAIATALHLSSSHLASVFRQATGLSVKGYLTQVRLGVAKRLLATTEITLDGLAERAGFCDASHVSRVFHRWVGCWPGEYRRQARGLAIATLTSQAPHQPLPPAVRIVERSKKCAHLSICAVREF